MDEKDIGTLFDRPRNAHRSPRGVKRALVDALNAVVVYPRAFGSYGPVGGRRRRRLRCGSLNERAWGGFLRARLSRCRRLSFEQAGELPFAAQGAARVITQGIYSAYQKRQQDYKRAEPTTA